jgi:hypothetical protein
MKKTKILKIVRIVLFCIGFPLLLLVTAIKTMPFFGEPLYKDWCAHGIFAILIMWALVEITRIIVLFACKKSRTLQTIIVAAVGVVVMAVPLILFDYLVGPKIDAYATAGSDFQLAFTVDDEGDVTVVSKDAAGATVIPMSFADLRYELRYKGKLETFGYQLGKYVPVTKPDRIDKSLYRVFLDKCDDFMDFYAINKWYNFKDRYSDNYTGFASDGVTPTNDGYFPGVQSTVDKEIELLQKAVIDYYRAYVANGNSEEGLAIPSTALLYREATGKVESTSHWTLTELYILRDELATKAKIYPLFAARNLIYIFIGLVAISTIGIGYINDKLAENKDEEEE